MNPPRDILTFDAVTLAGDPYYESGIDGFSATLGPGEMMVVRLSQGLVMVPLADAIQGLVDPVQGEIRFCGRAWATASAADEQQWRHRMGRVFEQEAWLSNLDVDENVTLAERFHSLRSEEEILAEATDISREFGLDQLPSTRPALTPRLDLNRCEWVRALLGKPALIVMERPGRDVPAAWTDILMKRIHRERERGAAVVWLTEDPAVWSHALARPALHFNLRDAKMVPVDPL